MKKENTFKCLLKDELQTVYEVGEITDNELAKCSPKYFAPYLFTAIDGKDIYTGDLYCYIEGQMISDLISAKATSSERYASSIVEFKIFSTQESAQAFLDEQSKPKFEVGKVYKDPSSNRMFMITDFKDIRNVNAYGFGGSGHWYNDNGEFEWGCENVVEATPSEWEAALIKEAERRGFKDGVMFLGVEGNKKNIKIKIGEKFKIEFDTIFNKGLYCDDSWILYNGIWADILEQPKDKTNYYYFNEWKKDITSPGFIDWLNSKSLIITPKPCHS